MISLTVPKFTTTSTVKRGFAPDSFPPKDFVREIGEPQGLSEYRKFGTRRGPCDRSIPKAIKMVNGSAVDVLHRCPIRQPLHNQAVQSRLRWWCPSMVGCRTVRTLWRSPLNAQVPGYCPRGESSEHSLLDGSPSDPLTTGGPSVQFHPGFPSPSRPTDISCFQSR